MLSDYERRVLSDLEHQLAVDSTNRRTRRMALLRRAELVISAALLVATAVAGMYLLLPQALALVGVACLGLAVGWQLGRRRAGRVTGRLSRLRCWLRNHP
jgi:4-hydroxybenzoate polyprenyltransferase